MSLITFYTILTILIINKLRLFKFFLLFMLKIIINPKLDFIFVYYNLKK